MVSIRQVEPVLEVMGTGSRGARADAAAALARLLLFEHGGRSVLLTHPDAAALRRILAGPTRTGPVELVFNHRSKTTEPWASAATRRRLDYTATYPQDAPAGAVLEL